MFTYRIYEPTAHNVELDCIRIVTNDSPNGFIIFFFHYKSLHSTLHLRIETKFLFLY
jgi:hypothetical protein